MIKHPLEDLMTIYLSEQDITKDTREVYRIILKRYISYLIHHHILYARSKDVISYRKRLIEEGYTKSWIYNQINGIKRFYQYLSKHHLRLNIDPHYAVDITESLKNEFKRDNAHKETLTPEQAKQLILSLKENRRCIWQYRDYAMIYLMLTTGLRSVEVRRAKKKDLRGVNQEHILDIQGKGRDSADEYIKITSGVKEAIDDYLKKRKDKNPYLFISHSRTSTKFLNLNRMFFQTMLDRVLKEANLDDIHITAHSLRHTAATLNLKRGGSMEQTKRFLRHTNMSNTLLYAHHIDSKEDHSSSELEDYILGYDNQEKKEMK